MQQAPKKWPARTHQVPNVSVVFHLLSLLPQGCGLLPSLLFTSNIYVHLHPTSLCLLLACIPQASALAQDV